MGQHSKASTAYQRALEIDPGNAEAIDGYRQCTVAVNSNPEEVRKRAMADPEVQSIMRDPAMRIILEQMHNDPRALQEYVFFYFFFLKIFQETSIVLIYNLLNEIIMYLYRHSIIERFNIQCFYII